MSPRSTREVREGDKSRSASPQERGGNLTKTLYQQAQKRKRSEDAVGREKPQEVSPGEATARTKKIAKTTDTRDVLQGGEKGKARESAPDTTKWTPEMHQKMHEEKARLRTEQYISLLERRIRTAISEQNQSLYENTVEYYDQVIREENKTAKIKDLEDSQYYQDWKARNPMPSRDDSKDTSAHNRSVTP